MYKPSIAYSARQSEILNKMPCNLKLWPVWYKHLILFSDRGKARCSKSKHGIVLCSSLVAFTAGIIDYEQHLNLLLINICLI